MHIAIDIRPLQEEGGGVVEYTKNIIVSLLRQDTQNTYVLFSNAYRRVPTIDISPFPHASIVALRYPNKLFNASVMFLRKPEFDTLIKRITGRAVDVFFAPNLNFFSFSKHRTTILTVHDVSFDIYPHFLTPKQYAWHASVRPKQAFQKFNHLISVSERTKHDLITRYHIPESKITVIPLGIDQTFSLPSNKNIISKRPYILSCGSHEPRKNIQTLIAAFAYAREEDTRLLSYTLIITGDTSRIPMGIYDSIKRFNLHDNIILKDFVPDDEWKRLVYGASAFVYPSIYEGFGLPPLEAMAAGVPVLVSANSSLAETAGSAALLIDYTNVRAFARALIISLTDDMLRALLIKEGRVLSSRFTWQTCGQKTLELFQYMYENRH